MANEEKKIYWNVEGTGDLSVTVETLQEAVETIHYEFCEERIHNLIADIQYTITPIQMTEDDFNDLPEFNG